MSLRVEHEPGVDAGRGVAPKARARATVERAEVNFERLRAPFSLRCGALLIDYIITMGVLAFATILARAFGDSGRASTFVLTVGYLTTAAVTLLNFVVLASFSGRTMGKWLAGLRIVRKDGEPLSFARALLRHVAGYALTLATLGLGFLLAAFNPQGRSLHDLVAGTVVVRSRAQRR